ncbi:MAG TPA: Trk system potassium transporter TrkA [Planctomycetes bacterium]|nr:Trk system potassium transporter TrkA [Planctomycetota bacterium]
MRIVIGGEDDVAVRLAEALQVEHDVTVVAPSWARGSKLENMEISVVHGLCTSGEALAEADIEHADVFVACTPVDERNLLACAEAKQLGPKNAVQADGTAAPSLKTICFLRRLDVQSTEQEANRLAKPLGIDHLVMPSEKLGQEISRIVLVPDALDYEIFENGQIRLIKQEIPEGSHITEGTLKEIGTPEDVVLIMIQKDDEPPCVPNGSTRFQAGDRLTAVGNMRGIHRLQSKWLRDPSREKSPRRVTVVGAGVVGMHVALGLEKAGWRVKVIESDPERCAEIAGKLKKGLVLEGDGSDIELLQDEYIGDDPVLIAVTSNDENNLLVSLLANQLGVRRVITRADKTSNEKLFEDVGVDVVLSTRGTAINSVLEIVNPRRDLVRELEHGDLSVLELEIPADLPPKPLKEFSIDGMFAIVGAIIRNDKVTVPRGEHVIQGSDKVLVFCAKSDEEDARRLFDQFTLDGD